MSYAYDEASRLKTMTRGTSNWTLAYDAASRRTSLLHPNTVTTTYAYDVVSRLTSAITKKANQTRTQSTYTYDVVGNRLTKGGDFNESYTYDALYRLTLVKRGNPTTESYTYDAVGNRLSALNSSPWTYDDRNELLSLPNTTLTYDLNGNMATKLDSSGSWSYVFDVEDRLVQVFKNSAEVSRFAYDPLGRRVEKVAGVVTRSYVYDGEDILRETSSSGPVLTYLHGPGIDEPLASEDAGGVRTYLHPDGLGSIVKTTNASGAAGSTFKYNAFGVIETGTPSPYAYTGREWDSEAGLYYYRARYYDPKIGRFISEDPSQIWSWPNLYAYVENNPVNYTDPLGLLKVKGGVALPTGPLLINLRCLEECLGREVELRISETTGEHAPGNPHTRGVAADFTVVPRDPFINPTPRNPAAISVPVPNMDVLCCARACSFAFTQYETQGTPGATAAHFHAQIPKGQGGAVQPTQTQCCGR